MYGCNHDKMNFTITLVRKGSIRYDEQVKKAKATPQHDFYTYNLW